VERLREQGHLVVDCGNVEIPVFAKVPEHERAEVIASVNRELYDQCLDIQSRGGFPLVLGGDHSIVMGSVAASTQRGETGLIWVDAHGDFNTPLTSPSGNVHGMPLAALLGLGDPRFTSIVPQAPVRAENVVLIGVRQLDPLEREAIKKAQVRVYSMHEVDHRGIHAVIQEALQNLRHTSRLHLSLDMDALDPNEAPGVGTPVRGGLTYREAHYIMEEIASTRRLVAMDVVEINPMLDVRNQTSVTAVDLVLSALGQTIL
jgi:arginase